MTFLLILGAVAALFILWMLFRLATYALPVCVGITAAFGLVDRGWNPLGAAAIGIGVGITILVLAQILYAITPPGAGRFAITALFAVPAAFAGYFSFESLGQLAVGDGPVLAALSAVAAIVTASGAWKALASSAADPRRSAGQRSGASQPSPPAPRLRS